MTYHHHALRKSVKISVSDLVQLCSKSASLIMNWREYNFQVQSKKQKCSFEGFLINKVLNFIIEKMPQIVGLSRFSAKKINL